MQLSIEKLIYGGDGLARTSAGADGRSMAVFIPFVLPGERVEVEVRREKPGFARGLVTQMIEASPSGLKLGVLISGNAADAITSTFLTRGNWNSRAQFCARRLQRIAKIELKSEIRLHASPPWNYRNRTRLQVRTAPFALGYFRFGSHEFLPVRECPISSPLINRVMARLLELGGLNCPAAVEEIELFADAGDEHLLAWAFCGVSEDKKDLLRWAEALGRELPEISGMTFFSSRRRVDEDEMPDPKALAQWGATAIRYRTRDHEYQVSAGAFFQVNRYLVDELVSVVTGNARGDLALDLYAGVGLFSAVLAENFHHIFNVEASQTAHGDCVQNVPANVKAVGARTEDYLRSRPAAGKARSGRAGPSSQRCRQGGDPISGGTRSAPRPVCFV
jgi:23S rRNA (uracil1939-C5)-methyltransferase